VRREGTGEASQATPNVEAAGEEVVQEDQHHGAVARARCAGGHQGKFFLPMRMWWPSEYALVGTWGVGDKNITILAKTLSKL
jgi:hypothetical protein